MLDPVDAIDADGDDDDDTDAVLEVSGRLRDEEEAEEEEEELDVLEREKKDDTASEGRIPPLLPPITVAERFFIPLRLPLDRSSPMGARWTPLPLPLLERSMMVLPLYTGQCDEPVLLSRVCVRVCAMWCPVRCDVHGNDVCAH